MLSRDFDVVYDFDYFFQRDVVDEARYHFLEMAIVPVSGEWAPGNADD